MKVQIKYTHEVRKADDFGSDLVKMRTLCFRCATKAAMTVHDVDEIYIETEDSEDRYGDSVYTRCNECGKHLDDNINITI